MLKELYTGRKPQETLKETQSKEATVGRASLTQEAVRHEDTQEHVYTCSTCRNSSIRVDCLNWPKVKHIMNEVSFSWHIVDNSLFTMCHMKSRGKEVGVTCKFCKEIPTFVQ